MQGRADVMAEQYLLKKGERQIGPFSLADMRKMIRSGAVGRFQNVSTDGGGSWASASTFPELWESTDLVPVPEPPVVPGPPMIAPVMPPEIPDPGTLAVNTSTDPQVPPKGGKGLGLAGFITATTGLVLTIAPLLIWTLRYPDGYWAVPLVFPLLVASITGLVLSCVALGRRGGGFATTGLVVGICASALGLVTAIGWLVSHDPRDAWIVRLTATAEADVQLARKNYTASLKRYRDHAPNDDHASAMEQMTKDILSLTEAHNRLLQAAASTPRFRRHFVRLEDLKASYISFDEAVKLRDKIKAQEAIDKIGRSAATLKELLDLWDLYNTGQLTIESVQAKFRDP